MARSNIHFDENRQKLVKIASRLFMERGYENTSINDILRATGISRGAMYHYFASKEEILDMVIDYLMSLQDSQINAIISDRCSSALDKFEKLLLPAAPPPKETLEVQQHMQQNTKSLFFYLSKEEARRRSVPLVAKIVEQGVSEGVFHTDYPAQMADYIYTVAQSLSAVFSSGAKERDNKDLDAFLFLMQQALGMNDDAVRRLKESFAKSFSLNR